jgi:hypothetical protein
MDLLRPLDRAVHQHLAEGGQHLVVNPFGGQCTTTAKPRKLAEFGAVISV